MLLVRDHPAFRPCRCVRDRFSDQVLIPKKTFRDLVLPFFKGLPYLWMTSDIETEDSAVVTVWGPVTNDAELALLMKERIKTVDYHNVHVEKERGALKIMEPSL